MSFLQLLGLDTRHLSLAPINDLDLAPIRILAVIVADESVE